MKSKLIFIFALCIILILISFLVKKNNQTIINRKDKFENVYKIFLSQVIINTENLYVNFNDEVNIVSFRNEYKNRFQGSIIIWGEYEKEQDLESFYKLLNTDVSYDKFKDRKTVYIKISDSSDCYIHLYEENRLKMEIITKFPYDKIKGYIYDKYQQYYLQI